MVIRPTSKNLCFVSVSRLLWARRCTQWAVRNVFGCELSVLGHRVHDPLLEGPGMPCRLRSPPTLHAVAIRLEAAIRVFGSASWTQPSTASWERSLDRTDFGFALSLPFIL